MITPERAPVRPRVKRKVKEDDAAFLLEEEIAELALKGWRGVVVVAGPSGSGKSTAIQHLAAVLSPADGVKLFDPSPADSQLYGGMAPLVLANHTLVVTTMPIAGTTADVEFELATWGQDEWIEYLLACHPAQVKSVMARLLAGEESRSANYSAEIWRVVLDEMAADETVASPLDAMICRLSKRFSREQQLAFSPLALDYIRTTQFIPWTDAAQAVPELNRPDWRLLNQPLVVSWIAAAYAARLLKAGSVADEDCCLERIEQLPRSYLYNLAALVRGDGPLTTKLTCIAQADIPQVCAAAVSVLHLAGALPQPAAGNRLVRSGLAGAILEGVQWPRVVLTRADLVSSDFSGANLFQANLDVARAWRADFSHADLREASLHQINLRAAILLGVNLSRAKASEGDFAGADFREAIFNDADLREADFRSVNLAGASLRCAYLSGASLRQAKIDGTDFTRADLSRAALDGLDFNAAEFRESRFMDASCKGCILDGVELPLANSEGANFSNATFTGASMPGANLQRAYLHGCGLADVDWERADLRNADLRGAVFSMGGSRSGLVGSPYPGHGTRTGFYTDDYNDLSTHKHPEEIRKANLCGADLRGAKIEGVDFYLVDLRGALYDPGQAEQLRRCGAILREPVA